MDDKRSTVQVVATFSVVKKLAPHLEAEIRAMNSSVFRLEGVAVQPEAIPETAPAQEPEAEKPAKSTKKSGLVNRILGKGK